MFSDCEVDVNTDAEAVKVTSLATEVTYCYFFMLFVIYLIFLYLIFFILSTCFSA